MPGSKWHTEHPPPCVTPVLCIGTQSMEATHLDPQGGECALVQSKGVELYVLTKKGAYHRLSSADVLNLNI